MKFAIVKNGICENIIVAGAEYAAKIGAVEIPEGFGIGDVFDGESWEHPEPGIDPAPTMEERVATLETDVSDLTAAVERGLAL